MSTSRGGYFHAAPTHNAGKAVARLHARVATIPSDGPPECQSSYISSPTDKDSWAWNEAGMRIR
jgi:hypothetical protein